MDELNNLVIPEIDFSGLANKLDELINLIKKQREDEFMNKAMLKCYNLTLSDNPKAQHITNGIKAKKLAETLKKQLKKKNYL